MNVVSQRVKNKRHLSEVSRVSSFPYTDFRFVVARTLHEARSHFALNAVNICKERTR